MRGLFLRVFPPGTPTGWLEVWHVEGGWRSLVSSCDGYKGPRPRVFLALFFSAARRARTRFCFGRRLLGYSLIRLAAIEPWQRPGEVFTRVGLLSR